MFNRYQQAFLTAILAVPSISAFAQQDAPKAVVAVVGDADRFTIGQEDFVGDAPRLLRPAKAIPHSLQ
jgi:hypothetical protein